MKTFLSLSALIAVTIMTPAGAQPLTVLDEGENFTVAYDPSYEGNVAGGGRVQIADDGEMLQIQYRDGSFAMQAPGVPVFIGGSEGNIAYLPSGNSVTVTTQR